MKILNNKASKIDLCGTPNNISLHNYSCHLFLLVVFYLRGNYVLLILYNFCQNLMQILEMLDNMLTGLSYLWGFSTSSYRLWLDQLISDLMGLLILRFAYYFCKNSMQNSLNFVLKFWLVYQIVFLLFSKQHHKLRDQKKKL